MSNALALVRIEKSNADLPSLAQQSPITGNGTMSSQSACVQLFVRFDNMVKACDLSGNYHDWFSPSAQFYFNNRDTVHSGAELWEVMKSPALFGNYEKLAAEIRISTCIYEWA